MKIVLGRGRVNTDRPERFGRTLLLYATLNGHEGVVKILFGRGEVCLDGTDKYGRTPL